MKTMPETSQGWTTLSRWRFPSIVLLAALAVLGVAHIRRSSSNVGLKTGQAYLAGDIAKLVSPAGITVVARTPYDMAEYVRCMALSRDGKEAESRELLKSLLDQKRVTTVGNGTSVMFLERFAGKPPTDSPPYVPWSRFVRVRLLDGAGTGLEVWTDEVLLGTPPRHP
jgi:hypothetical protein